MEWRSEGGYPAPGIAAVALVIDHERVLLVRDPVAADVWRLPEVFQRLGESIVHACERAVPVRQGVARAAEFVGVWSDPARDPRGHVVAFVYRVEADARTDDASAHFSLSELPAIAREHAGIVRSAWQVVSP